MDKSQEYILMCEKAEEIQKSYKNEPDENGHIDKEWNVGDVLFRYGEVEVSSYEGDYGLPDRQDGEVWLPRQDQLQEMINEVNYHKVWNFYEFVMDDIGSESKKSMEQLWLAYVMRHKYNKIWSEKDWIKKERKWKNK